MRTALHEITLKKFRLFCIPYELLRGQKLFSSPKKLFLEKEDKENVEINMRFTMKMI